MKLAKLFKQGLPYAETRRMLGAAMGAGKITEETDVLTALRLVLGSPDYLDSHNTLAIMMAVKFRGPEFGFPVHNARELLWLLERLDREYELKHKKQFTD
jgi:hypothetical protein